MSNRPILPDDPLGDLWVVDRTIAIQHLEANKSAVGSRSSSSTEEDDLLEYMMKSLLGQGSTTAYSEKQEVTSLAEYFDETETSELSSDFQNASNDFDIYKQEYWSYIATDEWTGIGSESWNGYDEDK